MSSNARNLDTYNDWRAEDNEPDVGDLLEIIRNLSDVAQWYESFYHDVQHVTPEYFDRCGDLNATQYLYGEVGAIRQRALTLLAEWDTPEQDAEPDYADLPL